MPSHNKIRRLVYMSLLIALAMGLSYFERFIPMPMNVPGMKLGLANIITVIAIYYFKGKEVFLIVILRVVLTAAIAGSGMSFFYSLAGGVLSFIGMKLLHYFAKKWISTVGLSVVGAVLHNVGQLSVLAVVSNRISISLSYAPVLMISGVFTGVFVGLSAMYFMKHTHSFFR